MNDNRDSRQMMVKVGALPGGNLETKAVPAGSTYRDVLAAANYPIGDTSMEVRVNGKPVLDLLGVARDGDQVLIFAKIKGN